MVIGNTPQISRSLFAPGYTLASVMANQFNEAVGPMHTSALVELGLVLFVVSMVVNAGAQVLVWSVTRGMPARNIA
jgi:phosphate transport system permease protein